MKRWLNVGDVEIGGDSQDQIQKVLSKELLAYLKECAGVVVKEGKVYPALFSSDEYLPIKTDPHAESMEDFIRSYITGWWGNLSQSELKDFAASLKELAKIAEESASIR
jgi:hypothetical protein